MEIVCITVWKCLLGGERGSMYNILARGLPSFRLRRACVHVSIKWVVMQWVGAGGDGDVGMRINAALAVLIGMMGNDVTALVAIADVVYVLRLDMSL